MDEYREEYLEWLAEARRIANAEVDRAVREFENGEDVRYPCYSSITDGRTTRHFNGEMRVIYPAGKPVIGTLSAWSGRTTIPTRRERKKAKRRAPKKSRESSCCMTERAPATERHVSAAATKRLWQRS